MDIKAPEHIIIFLISNPYTTDFKSAYEILRPKDEFMDVTLQLQRIVEQSNIETFYIFELSEKFSRDQVLEQFR